MAIKYHVHNFFIGGQNFKREFRKQIRLWIILTLAFTIAFSWRQTVFDATQSIVKALTGIQNSAEASILTSIAITIISIFLIYLTARFIQ